MRLRRVHATRRIDNRLLSTWLKAGAVEGIMNRLVVDVEARLLKLALVLGGMRDTWCELAVLLLLLLLLLLLAATRVIRLGVSAGWVVEMGLLGEEIGVQHGGVED